MPFSGAKDGKHYWLTPPPLLRKIYEEFKITFDPCPYPKPEDFDGLSVEWGESNYVNPPFGVVMHEGKKKGATGWVRKAIAEFRKGKKVVFVYPIDKWVLMMIEAGARIRNLRDVKWHSIEDDLPGKGTGRHIAMFILDPEDNHEGHKPLEGERSQARILRAARDLLEKTKYNDRVSISRPMLEALQELEQALEEGERKSP
jgi:hypothetical protein